MHANGSLLESLRSSPPEVRAAALASLSPTEAEALLYDWRGLWARTEQLAPTDPDWTTWLILSGRGWGKTRAGVEWVIEQAQQHPGWRIALVARTAADVRDTMVEGESGILACSPPGFVPAYEPSKRRLTWPNGSMATTFSGEEPKALRGPQHYAAWADEVASWQYAQDTWDNLQFGLRLGQHPRVVVTTTPRPINLLRDLMNDSLTRITRGSTFDNAANLAPSALAAFRRRYEGTRLGRQELYGEIMDDVPGALWSRTILDDSRVKEAPEMARIVVGVDPAVTSGEDSDDTGIVVVGKGVNGAYYVLADRSCHLSPDAWARRALIALDEFKGDRIIAEVNNGGDLVEATIRTARQRAPFKAVHASRGKRIRAEPVAALYEQGRVHHVGAMPQLEDQMVTFLPDGSEGSPDRVDALVWAITELSEWSAASFATGAFERPQRRW